MIMKARAPNQIKDDSQAPARVAWTFSLETDISCKSGKNQARLRLGLSGDIH